MPEDRRPALLNRLAVLLRAGGVLAVRDLTADEGSCSVAPEFTLLRMLYGRALDEIPGLDRTFDELRRKYERDSDFRRAVDNYIGDFERLLSQVSKDDTDPKVSRMYLTSDTGKVYTMLAHAAGRFDQ